MVLTPGWVRRMTLLVLAFLVTAALMAAWLAVRVYRAEARSVAPQRGAVGDVNWSGPPLEVVRFPSRSGVGVAAWWLPPSSGTVVVCAHGSGATRASLLPVMAVLVRHGYGVLALDWPGHGESGGRPDWGHEPIDVVQGALDWLDGREGAPPGVAAYGFSMGAYFVARAAATDGRIQRLIVEGCPTSIAEQIAHEYGRWGLLGVWPARLAVGRVGWDPHESTALESLSRVAPRPVLVIAGARDTAVPLEMARGLEATGSHTRLLVIQDAGHGECLEKAPALYEQALVEILGG